MNTALEEYIETQILPLYEHFDKGHQRAHAEDVIAQSRQLSRYYDTDEDMVYTIAAYHDTGLQVDRKTHHLESGRILREDSHLRKWFNEQQIETMAQAVEDHRASSEHAPRSLYGKIVAEADRHIDTDTILRRTIQFGLDHYPELSEEQHIERAVAHMHEKYARGGYLKLWIPESPNAERLCQLQDLIDNERELREHFHTIYQQETRNNNNTTI